MGRARLDLGPIGPELLVPVGSFVAGLAFVFEQAPESLQQVDDRRARHSTFVVEVDAARIFG
jgi:hypothetical protein